jgi:hypothetical protein
MRLDCGGWPRTPFTCRLVRVHARVANGPQVCPVGSAAPLSVGPNNYTTGGPVTQRSAQVPCTLGQTCSGGVMTPCAPGWSTLASNVHTCVRCAPGRWCAGGVPMLACGDATVFCADPALPPVNVSAGFYSAGGDSSGTATSQMPCDQGYFCVGGARIACPAGQFGCSTHTISPMCNGPCFEGYHCPPGSVSAMAVTCGSVGVFCPMGSAAPTNVTAGYYSVGGALVTTRWDQMICEAGFYCLAGVKYRCVFCKLCWLVEPRVYPVQVFFVYRCSLFT